MDRLKQIFDKQKKLMDRYEPIEIRSGRVIVPTGPTNLNDPLWQARLRDEAWRITEEVAEALDAKETNGNFREELMDVLHFLVEFTILSNKDYDEVTSFELDPECKDYLSMIYRDGTHLHEEGFEKLVCHFIRHIGLTVNQLKNKAWKQTHKDTNVNLYNYHLEMAWISFIGLLGSMGFEPNDILEGYMDKSSINTKRQETGY